MKTKLVLFSLSLVSIISTSWAYTIKLQNQTNIPIKITIDLKKCPKVTKIVDPNTSPVYDVGDCCVESIQFWADRTRAKELGLSPSISKIMTLDDWGALDRFDTSIYKCRDYSFIAIEDPKMGTRLFGKGAAKVFETGDATYIHIEMSRPLDSLNEKGIETLKAAESFIEAEKQARDR